MKKPDYRAVFWIGVLCFLGSFINTMGFIKYSLPMSHVTGNFVKSMHSAVSGKVDVFKYVVMIPLLFLSGTIISGAFFSEKIFDFGKKYGIYLIFLGIFLTTSTTLFHNKKYFLYFLSLTTGMQNGMYMNYKGSICRTTHMTGTITDFGTIIGNILGGNRENRYKLHYYFVNICSGISGMMAGGITYNQLHDQGFYIPALGYIVVGFTCLSKKIPMKKT